MTQKEKNLDVLLGDPKKAILSLLFPLIVSYAVVQANLFVDTYWVSGLGLKATSSINTISPLFWMINSVGLGLGIGASSTMAFRLGQRDIRKAGTLGFNAIVLGIAFSLIASVLMFLGINPIISLMGADDIRDLAISYVMPAILLSSVLILNGVVTGMLRSEGAGKKSMSVQLSAALFNMVLDPILIYELDMGVGGAGLATVLASLFSTMIGLSWYIRGKTIVLLNRDMMHATKADMAEVLNVAAPKTAESLINNTTNILQRIFIIISAGTMGTTWYNVPWRYVSISVIPSEAMGASVIPVCAANLGQGRPDKMKAAVNYAVRNVFIVTLCLSVFVFIFADPLMGVFTYSDSMAEQHDKLVWVLRIYAFLIIPFAFTNLGSSILQSLKKSKLAASLMTIQMFTKLTLFAIVCQYSFDYIVYSLILWHSVNGITMMYLAYREIGKRMNGSGRTPIKNQQEIENV